jgi:hypothetical protein
MMTHRLEIKTAALIPEGCFSTLLWDGRPFGVSVERTFAPGEAPHGKAVVVPPGLVLCRRVLFHKGNLEDQSEACVITGESFGGYDRRARKYSAHLGPDDQAAVLSSGVAFEELMAHAAGLQEFYALVSGRP